MSYPSQPYGAPAYTRDPTAVLGRRIVAHIIDLLLIGVIVVVVIFATAHRHTEFTTGYCNEAGRNCVQIGNTVYDTGGGGTGVGLFAVLAYWVVVGLIEGSTGAFVGKRILGLRVVGADGRFVGAARGALRGFLMLVDSMLCFVIGLVTAAASHPHRRVGDMAANSLVVAKEWVGHPVGGAQSGAYVPTPPPMWQPQASQPQAWQPQGAPPQEWQPQSAPPPAWQPQAAPQPPAQDPTEPQWDAARNAWIAWEPSRGKWMQFDATRNEWREM